MHLSHFQITAPLAFKDIYTTDCSYNCHLDFYHILLGGNHPLAWRSEKDIGRLPQYIL